MAMSDFDKWYEQHKELLNGDFLDRKGLARLAWGAALVEAAHPTLAPDAWRSCGGNYDGTSKRSVKQTADSWNKKYPVGTAVVVIRDNGDKLETVTRSEAWELCGSPVVMVKGISGGYALERMVPMKEKDHVDQ